MVTSAAQELASLLLRTREAPIESGATVLFESITGGSLVSADISVEPAGQLTNEERALLGGPVLADVHRREGTIRCATGLPIANITALVVTHRIPEPAHPALGIKADGHIGHTTQNGQAHTPLGRALRGLGVRREQLGVTASRYHLIEAGSEIAVFSVARLWAPSGWPLALVTERIHAQFLAAYPPPWPTDPTKSDDS